MTDSIPVGIHDAPTQKMRRDFVATASPDEEKTGPMKPLSTLVLEWVGRRDGADYCLRLPLPSPDSHKPIIQALDQGELSTAMSLPKVMQSLGHLFMNGNIAGWSLSFAKDGASRTIDHSVSVFDKEKIVAGYNMAGLADGKVEAVSQTFSWSDTDAQAGQVLYAGGTYCRYAVEVQDNGSINLLAAQAHMKLTESPSDVFSILEGSAEEGHAPRTLTIEAYQHTPGCEPQFAAGVNYPTRLFFQDGELSPVSSGWMDGGDLDDARIAKYMTLGQCKDFKLYEWEALHTGALTLDVEYQGTREDWSLSFRDAFAQAAEWSICFRDPHAAQKAERAFAEALTP